MSTRLIIILFSVVLVLISSLALLPYGIQLVMQQWLISQGASYADIRDVDFNPFTGESGSDLKTWQTD